VKRGNIHALPVLVLAALAGIFALGLRQDPSIVPSALLDQPVPVFTLPPLHDDGAGLASADLEGQVALVNIFASWCLPCRAEHPLLTRLAEEGEIPVLGINYKDPEEQARQWLVDLGDPYERIGVDRDGRAGIEWGVYGVPETFLVDSEGVIRFKHVGPLTAEALKKTIVPLARSLRK
jgi:cytochrome c biogenesis protein CcmG/thiol:disulfide interchange protein DsbE